MSKEAMKLALEHAKRDERHINHAETRYWCRMYKDIAEKAVEALEKPDFWEGYVPEPDKRQQALDKKAENARELGLDYEPVWGGGPTNKDYEDAMRHRRLHQLTAPPAQPVQDNPLDCGVYLGSGKDHEIKHHVSYGPAQQEPVAWMYVNKSTHETKFQKQMRGFVDHSLWSEVPLYGEPLANHELQCVCGAVWLGDEMVHLPDKHPPAQRTWVGLTDDEVISVMPDDDTPMSLGEAFSKFAELVEAKLKEKNT